ncbi:FAD-dependent oxidoreductase [Agromyces sp. NPDC056965]|uniref:FAD-dependent oxidoreductase n=1 Tax=Agromyces sp. NPDC056965 TaxID=3345983 RepID=UPI0036289576
MVAQEIVADVVIIGGGLGGVAAALAALERGATVVLTEEFDWLGGQLTSQAVPPDEHPWIEEFGATRSYRALRSSIRDGYRRAYPLTDRALALSALNPGAGWVSKLCHEPRMAVAAIEERLAPWRSSGALTILRNCRPVSADVDGDHVRAVTVEHLTSGARTTLLAPYFVDATETGELLPITTTEYITGFEAQSETGEPSAPHHAQPQNMQAISVCFAMDHVDGDHTIDRPVDYDHWRGLQPDFWGAPLLSFTAPNPRTLETGTRVFEPNPGDDPYAVEADQSKNPGDHNLWSFRRILARDLFAPGRFASDITLVNWPSIDYFEASVIDVPAEEAERNLAAARSLSRSFFYWLQTEAPRADGGVGHPGLRLRGDVTGSADGLAQAPYIRESRRIRAMTTIVEQDVSRAARGAGGARRYDESVGIGMYRIDLHPTTGGDNYLDVPAEPFEIPLGALVPRRMRNLIPAGKNIGTTHITNGCYRLHPVEWNIGEVAGHLAAVGVMRGSEPHAVLGSVAVREEFQRELVSAGIELHWPKGIEGY